VNLFALGCFFTSQAFVSHHNMESSSMECCGAGDYQFNNHAGYNLQYSVTYNTYGFINLLIFFILVSVLFFKEVIFLNYYLIKDRYGGFKLFDKFILLFKKGIINPKLY